MSLGWVRNELFIYVKRMLNARSIAVLDDISIYKRILIHRMTYYSNNLEEGRNNRCNSPIFDLLKVSESFGVYDDIMGMFHGVREFGKKEWKDLIWLRTWEIELVFSVYAMILWVCSKVPECLGKTVEGW